MTTTIIILLAVLVFCVAAYFGWRRWFRDSEVNLVADAMTYAGMVAELLVYLDDPGITEMLSKAGIEPVWLILFGIIVRLARRFRDQTMAVMKPYEDG